jgi:hypothetical protein
VSTRTDVGHGATPKGNWIENGIAARGFRVGYNRGDPSKKNNRFFDASYANSGENPKKLQT